MEEYKYFDGRWSVPQLANLFQCHLGEVARNSHICIALLQTAANFPTEKRAQSDAILRYACL